MGHLAIQAAKKAAKSAAESGGKTKKNGANKADTPLNEPNKEQKDGK